MNWIKLYSQDLENALTKTQIELLKAEELKSAGKPISEEVLSMVIAQIRAKIASYEANFLDYDHSKIPQELKLCALRLAVEALQSRIPSMELGIQQKKLADISRADLEDISSGKITISTPQKPIKIAREKKAIFYSKNKNTRRKRR